MAFQDALEINEARMEDSKMKGLATVHRREDAGHDGWFFEDLKAFGVEPPSAQGLFGSLNKSTRHASFALFSEVYSARNDTERCVFLLALESSGHILFRQLSSYCAAATDRKLKYFSKSHLAVEQDHDLFEGNSDEFISAIELSEADRASCISLVDRCYREFTRIIDGMETVLESPTARVSA